MILHRRFGNATQVWLFKMQSVEVEERENGTE